MKSELFVNGSEYMSKYAIIFVASIIICIMLNLPLYPAFILLLLGLMTIRPTNESLCHRVQSIWNEINRYKELYLVIVLIGMNISAWVISGILPMMMYEALKVLDPQYFLPSAFILMSIASILMGTGVGTLCSFGMVLLTVGNVYGIHTPVTLGALVSGAFFADRISPISALVQLTLKEYRVTYRDFLIKGLPGLVITLAICTIIYGLFPVEISGNSSNQKLFMDELSNNFAFSPWLWMIPVSMLFSAILGIKSSITLSISVVISSSIAVLYQGEMVLVVLKQLLFGVSADHLAYLQIGGGVGMLEVVFMVAVALGCASYLFTEKMSKFIHRFKKTKRQEILVLSALSVTVNAMTCDQSLGIVMPKSYSEKQPLAIATAVSSTGTVMAPLMPWNVNSIIIMSIMGYSAWDYLSYSYMNWILPIVTILILLYQEKRISDKI